MSSYFLPLQYMLIFSSKLVDSYSKQRDHPKVTLKHRAKGKGLGGWDNIPDICCYGERGILNAIIMWMKREQPLHNAVKRFLKTIKWAGEGHRNRTPQLADSS